LFDCLLIPNGPFTSFTMLEQRGSHILTVTVAQLPTVRPLPQAAQVSRSCNVEVDMTGKITAALVAAIVLATAGAASAQTVVRAPQVNATWQNPANGPYYNSYYNRDYWDAIASRTQPPGRDPFVGTVFENVVPY
jgi:hypothetical protein